MMWPKRVTIILTPDGRAHVFREGDADLWPQDARRTYVLQPKPAPKRPRKKSGSYSGEYGQRKPVAPYDRKRPRKKKGKK